MSSVGELFSALAWNECLKTRTRVCPSTSRTVASRTTAQRTWLRRRTVASTSSQTRRTPAASNAPTPPDVEPSDGAWREVGGAGLSDPAGSRQVYGQPASGLRRHTGYWNDARMWKDIDVIAADLAAAPAATTTSTETEPAAAETRQPPPG